MLYQITQFLLDVAVSLVAGACLLRLYMQLARAPFGNPVGQFVLAMSNWLVLPLRRVIPALGRLDAASLVAALLLETAMYLVLWLLLGMATSLVALLALIFFDLLHLAITGLMVLVLVYAVLSWVPSRSALDPVFERLCAPLLAPLRRVLPRPGGFDLSTLVALVLLQVVSMVLASLQTGMMGAI